MSKNKRSSSTNAGKLLESLGLPQDTKRAKRWLRSNKKIVIYDEATEALAACDPSTVDGKFDEERYTRTMPVSGHYVNSLHVCRAADREDVFEMYSDTIVRSYVEMNFWCTVHADGTVLSGRFNTFLFGMMKIDQGYIDELLEEWAEAQYKWDVVTSTADVSPPAKRTKPSDPSADQPSAEAPPKQNTETLPL